MIKCAKCGKNYKFTRNSGLARWGCANYVKIGKVECPSKLIPEEELERLTCEALGLEEFDEAAMRKHISSIEADLSRGLVFHMRNGELKRKEWRPLSRSASWTPEMRARMSAIMKERQRCRDRQSLPEPQEPT